MNRFDVTGMSCAACSARVEKAVAAVDGVTRVSVNLLSNSMNVEGSASIDDIIMAVENAGYGASIKSDSATKTNSIKDEETPRIKKRLIASIIFLIALMYISMGHMMWNFPLPKAFANNHIALGMSQMLLTIIVMVINQKFFINGFRGLIKRSPNMDTLVALGASAAFLYSTYALFMMTFDMSKISMNDFYFESAAMILTLITVGKMLEARSKGKTTDAIKGLMDLTPKTAVVLRDEKEVRVSISDVKIDDIFIVRPGESIPVDGVVTEGRSAVNEASLTGESIPVDKAEGDNVSAATINQSGLLKCKATRVGEDTTIAKIIQMVSDASASKAPIAKIADKVSGVFVPVVIGIAILTIIIWLMLEQNIGFAIARGISVLVISCPCALGLATPVAIMVGNGVGAKNGILYKNATALELAGKIDIIAFDKTGTITIGEPKVTDIVCNDGVLEDELLRNAYLLEINSEHPLARAIVQYCDKMTYTGKIEAFMAHPGNGLEAKIDDEVVISGNFKFVDQYSRINDELRKKSIEFANEGKTPLFFCKNDKFLGIIAVADVIKQESSRTISELKDMGIKTIMLTGDNEATANAIATKVGIDEVYAGVLPDKKDEIVRELKKKGRVAMVGDGINDAPALTSADIGIAIGAGTDIAIDAADIVLVKSKLDDVQATIRLGRYTLRNIHENLFWAFIYNVLGIPLAAGVFIYLFGWTLNPMFGAAAMSLSSFCVVSNALRLNLKKIKKGELNDMKKTMKIEGMMCGHCEANVKKALEALENVTEANVNHKKGIAEVMMTEMINDDILKATVEEKGYTVKDIK